MYISYIYVVDTVLVNNLVKSIDTGQNVQNKNVSITNMLSWYTSFTIDKLYISITYLNTKGFRMYL